MQISMYEVAKCAMAENRGRWYVRGVAADGCCEDEDSAARIRGVFASRKSAQAWIDAQAAAIAAQYGRGHE